MRAAQVSDLDLLPTAGLQSHFRSSSSCALGRTRSRMKKVGLARRAGQLGCVSKKLARWRGYGRSRSSTRTNCPARGPARLFSEQTGVAPRAAHGLQGAFEEERCQGHHHQGEEEQERKVEGDCAHKNGISKKKYGQES